MKINFEGLDPNNPQVYTTQEEAGNAWFGKGTASQNFSYFDTLRDDIAELDTTGSDLTTIGSAGLSRYTYAEIENDLRENFYQQVDTNQEILAQNGCQIIEGYVCDADCNRIAKASSTCPPNYTYTPIKPSAVISLIIDKMLNGIEEDRRAFVQRCNYYKSKGWKLEAYAQPNLLKFYIKFFKIRDNEKDIIDESVPIISQFKIANIFLPLTTIVYSGGTAQVDPYQSMIDQIKAKWINKVFMLKYHWDQKEQVCKDLSLPLNIDSAGMISKNEEYLTSIDANFSARAPIYRYSSILGKVSIQPELDFNNTKDLDPYGKPDPTPPNPSSFLIRFKEAGEVMDDYMGLNKIETGLSSLGKMSS